MASTTEMTARERLLAATMEHVVEHGVGTLTLRGLAEALGTSHRMLIYHFGSREGLLIEVIRAVEQQTRAALTETLQTPGATDAEIMWANWDRVADASLWANERLFFEIYTAALQGNEYARPLLDGIVDDWVEPVTALMVARGCDEAEARADARLGVAVVRGLLLDLLATRDRDAVDAAMRRYIEAVT